jgi:hypothetical protein
VKCAVCRREIRRGVEEQKRVEYHRQPDGTIKIFGYQMPDGELSKATGPLVKVIHSKHYWSARKTEERGGPHAGGAISAEESSIENFYDEAQQDPG